MSVRFHYPKREWMRQAQIRRRTFLQEAIWMMGDVRAAEKNPGKTCRYTWDDVENRLIQAAIYQRVWRHLWVRPDEWLTDEKFWLLVGRIGDEVWSRRLRWREARARRAVHHA